MGTRRRAEPAAIAAALLGAGLVLYSFHPMPELRAGSRAAPPASAALAWPAVPGLASAAGGGFDGYLGTSPLAADKGGIWRDAPADRAFGAAKRVLPAARVFLSAAARPTRAQREVPASAARRAQTRREAAPSAAKMRAVHSAGPHGSSPTTRGRTTESNALSRGMSSPYRPGRASAQAALRRSPLASGPAAADDADGKDAASARTNAGRSNTTSWMRHRTHSFPLFKPPRREARAPRSSDARRRARPLLLSKLLGPGALRPPPASIVPPDLSSLQERKPPLLPNGAPVPARPYELSLLESLDPRRAAGTDRRRTPHWDAGPRWHDGSARGMVGEARWLWLWKEEARWWAVRESPETPLLHHRGLWWSKQRGVWFALHDGELWTWRRFSDWDAEGLVRLTDGVQLVYSADFTKVAVITPGAGAVLYDAATGAALGQWRDDELPRRRPRAPERLRLSSGI